VGAGAVLHVFEKRW